MSRTAYHREYHRRTVARRRERKEAWDAARWLLANLQWPAEPALIVPRSHPIRRPLLRLRKP